MKIIYFSLLLLFISAAFAQLNISNPFYVAGVLKPAASTCNTNCAASVFCEKLENAFSDPQSTTGGTPGSFISEARGSCSYYFHRYTLGDTHSLGDSTVNDSAGNTANTFTDFWFRIRTNTITSTSTVKFLQAAGTGNVSPPWHMMITNAAGQLQVMPIDNQGLIANTWQNITTNQWYHAGVRWDSGADVMVWYLSTTDALGSAIDTTAPTGTSRSIGVIEWGYVGRVGTVTGTAIDFDSITVDGTAFSPIEYQ